MALKPEVVEEFFNKLPEEDYEEWECTLREALLDAMQEAKITRFPLSEWIERRVGCEIAIDVKSQVGEIWPLDPAVAATVFLKSLNPADWTCETEENLRHHVLDFLTDWVEKENPSVKEVSEDPAVAPFIAEFLTPHHVTLEMWVPKRIGAEVRVRKGPGGHVSLELRPDMTSSVSKMGSMPSMAIKNKATI